MADFDEERNRSTPRQTHKSGYDPKLITGPTCNHYTKMTLFLPPPSPFTTCPPTPPFPTKEEGIQCERGNHIIDLSQWKVFPLQVHKEENDHHHQFFWRSFSSASSILYVQVISITIFVTVKNS